MIVQHHTLNWVRRKKKAEGHLETGADYLWRNVCDALDDACRSYAEEYNGQAEGQPVNRHHFRVTYFTPPTKKDLDVDFDRQKLSIVFKYQETGRSITFTVTADEESAFIVDKDCNRVTPDEVSRLTLEPVFFPPDSTGGWVRGTRLV